MDNAPEEAITSHLRKISLVSLPFEFGKVGKKGKASPTLRLGLKTKSQPRPNVNQALNPVALL
jgi:2-oxoglutarate ferredoxin oxidoreductase subunit beta